MAFYKSIKDNTVQVEAIKFDGSSQSVTSIRNLISITGDSGNVSVKRGMVVITTRDGKISVSKGYYVVKDSVNNVFVSSPLSFTSIYEAGTAQTATGATSVGEVDTNLATHIADTANPHSVTASQAGAYTTGDVDALMDTKDNYVNWVVADDGATTEDVTSGFKLDILGSTQSNYYGLETFLSAGNLELRFNLNGLTVAPAIDGASDYIALYDASTVTNSKVTPQSLIDGTTALTEGTFTLNNSLLRRNSTGSVEAIQIIDNTLVGRISAGEVMGYTAGQVQTFLGLGELAYLNKNTTELSSYYTGTYISNNFDNYQNWVAADSAGSTEVISTTNKLDIIGSNQSSYLGVSTFFSAGDLQIRLDVNGLAVAAAVANTADYLLLYDTGAATNTKTTPESLIAATTAVTEADFVLNNSLLRKNNTGTIESFVVADNTLLGRISTNSAEVVGQTAGQVETFLGLGTMAKETATDYYTSGQVDSGFAAIVGTPADNQVAVWTGDGTLEGESNLYFSGGVLNVTGTLTVDEKEVYDEGDVAWIDNDNDSTPTWSFDTSHNFAWTPTAQATGDLTITGMVDGDSGVLIIASDTNGTLTLPANSDPASIVYTSSAVIVATVLQWVDGATTRYLWTTRSTSVTPT